MAIAEGSIEQNQNIDCEIVKIVDLNLLDSNVVFLSLFVMLKPRGRRGDSSDGFERLLGLILLLEELLWL